jgi:ABC-2 type transport system ATP-binding protein
LGVGVITTRDLVKQYGSGRGPRRHGTLAVRALDGVSLDVRGGEIFGFLGPNGAGKSTLIRLLLGFLHPTAGHATVLGLDTERESVAIRARVGYLPGGIALYDGLTGARHLDYLGELSGRPSVRRGELCDRLELPARTLARPIRDYSRGMRQKIGIVQALQHDPEIAILDEPSEGLDPLMQRAFYGILDDVRAAGRTVFFSSHVLSEVERVCDRVAIVRAGRLVALEDVGELVARRRRSVTARLAGPAPDLSGVAGVTDLEVAGGVLTCALAGDPGPFLDALRGVALADLVIEPARLEDVFLELYEGEAADEASHAVDRGAAWSGGSGRSGGSAGSAGSAGSGGSGR